MKSNGIRDLPLLLGVGIGALLGTFIVAMIATSLFHLYSVRTPSVEDFAGKTPMEALQLMAAVDTWPRVYNWPTIIAWGLVGGILGGSLLGFFLRYLTSKGKRV